MKMKEITVSADLKATKNFQSAGASISLTATVDENESLKDAYESLSEKVSDMLDIEISKGIASLNSL